MEYQNTIEFFFRDIGVPFFTLKVILGFIVPIILCNICIPTILKISKRKNLMDEPGIRSSHNRKIPNLGGIAIFYGISICVPLFAYQLFETYKFLFPALVILLYIGVMDDIVVTRALKKLIVQLIVATLIVVGSDVRIKSLFGLFGIHELNYVFSVLFSIVTFIIIINSFNLIDGIDGLSASFAIVCYIVYAISYYRLGSHNYPMVIFCIIIIGALVGFLRFNLSKGRKKIFMGDTGSLIIGFLLAFTSIYFINIFVVGKGTGDILTYHLSTAPVIAFSLLILPMIDTLNVIIIRILKKRSPFEADKNHIHHKWLKLGMSHINTTFCMVFYYLFIIFVAYKFRHIDINLLFILILSLGFLGAYIPDIIYWHKKRRRMKNTKILALLFLISLISKSCITTKEVRYLQPNEHLTLNEKGLIPYSYEEYKVTKNDIFRLNVITTPEGDAAQFYSAYNTSGVAGVGNVVSNRGGQSGTVNGGNASFYFDGIKVNEDGNIYVFGIGNIAAEGRKVSDIQKDIQEKVDENFLEGKSEVRLNLDGITYYILGDLETVGMAGEKKYYKQHLSIIEALAANGGLNRTVDKRNIILERHYPEGIKRVKLDLTREDIMNSPYYWVQNGDVILLNTREKSLYGFGKEPLQTLTTGVSLVTTALSIYLLISRF
ncbi:UDP-N-acetylmuramyl pentapeptide phosphotransferase/UDP-N-acetylglucosamine-1-phosphate transferase [Riemerella columbipharyngis]|uniref:UDP-N-acetylmuramyl pentapeptide phosphotransferase/UDP-N-acetylglucosamine-1-phosphate transferase n=2 Tax=Riemerella columbipharyngis TaxID=1071918 RepID=A0A1G7ELL7_9FLAO|nr:UDP-N-acetylmuramyl pentapeptide phosphotransferase/UDP-N-acetylglucosamine-1-phosphate transferase [Riemerella columbipharyngis]